MALHEVLCALLLEGPSHGYQLQATLQAELGPLWETRQSQLYLTVGRMQRDGLIVVRRQRQESLPDRQLLKLTDRGSKLAETWLSSTTAGDDLVIRLAVARLVVADRFEEIAAAAMEERQSALRELRALRREVGDGFQAEAVDHEVRLVEAELRWVSAVRDSTASIVSRARGGRRRRVTEDVRLA